MGINDILTKLFGNKSTRDLKETSPWVDKVKEAYPTIEALSNDELRQRTADIRTTIQNSVLPEREEIEKLKEGIEELDMDEREKVYANIDKIEKDIVEKLEAALDEALPEVFSIVKDTARRFTQNEEIVVTATQFDRDLAPPTISSVLKVTRPSTKTIG